MHLIGIEFSRERRSVVGFEVETLMVSVASSGRLECGGAPLRHGGNFVARS
jgi:hypothetical protein